MIRLIITNRIWHRTYEMPGVPDLGDRIALEGNDGKLGNWIVVDRAWRPDQRFSPKVIVVVEPA